MGWIEQNKEWFLSGAGIFLLSSIVSFASVLIALRWQSRAEKKKEKRLRISTTLNKFSAPTSNLGKEISPEHVKVSYKGTEYNNLCLYSVTGSNYGIPAITEQRLHFLFPSDAEIIEVFQEKTINSIGLNIEEHQEKNTKEVIYTFDRLEPNDSFSISYLLNIEDTESIDFEPRGVDGIEYTYSGEFERSDIEKIIYFIAIFVFSGAVPIIGSVIQGLVILASTPYVLEFYRRHFSSSKTPDSSFSVNGGIHIDENGSLTINQIH